MPAQNCTGTKSCVCQVCTCGHHNCPPGRVNANQHHEEHHFAGNSEYDERYKQHDAKDLKRPQKVIAQYKPNPDKLDGASTSKSDYKAWEVHAPKMHQQAPYKENPDKFQGQSVTETDYKAWDVQKRSLHAPEKATFTKDNRDWSTNNADSYMKHDPQARYQHPKAVWHPSDDKFAGESTSAADYVAKEVHRRIPRASEKAKITKDDRDWNTNNNTSYTPHDPQARYQHPKAVWHPSENKFAGQSTSSSDYTAKPVQQRHLHAAEKAIITADDRDFSTNNAASYQAHETKARYQHPKAVWHPSENKFAGESIATSDYTEKHVPRAQPIKPPTNMTLPTLKFEGQSIYHDAYEQKQMPDRYRHEQAKYAPNPDKFAGISSNKTDYLGEQLAGKTESFKPNLKYNPDKEQRDFGTENHQMFTVKAREHCRVYDMKGVHTEKAKDGHIYYDQAVPSAV